MGGSLTVGLTGSAVAQIQNKTTTINTWLKQPYAYWFQKMVPHFDSVLMPHPLGGRVKYPFAPYFAGVAKWMDVKNKEPFVPSIELGPKSFKKLCRVFRCQEAGLLAALEVFAVMYRAQQSGVGEPT